MDDLLEHPDTIARLQALSRKHRFYIFEDRKFVDIGSTVQKQYAGGVLHISDWAHIVNCSVLAGPGIVEALEKSSAALAFPHAKKKELAGDGERGLLILAEMTSKGSLAKGAYTAASVDYARQHRKFILGFVATKALSGVEGTSEPASTDEDFLVFTTGVNLQSKGDALGQQYNTPSSAVAGGADFIICGRGIYAAPDPVDAARRYKEAGWSAYLQRVKPSV